MDDEEKNDGDNLAPADDNEEADVLDIRYKFEIHG